MADPVIPFTPRRDCKCSYCVNYFLDKPNRAAAKQDSPWIRGYAAAAGKAPSDILAGMRFTPLPTGPGVEDRSPMASLKAATDDLRSVGVNIPAIEDGGVYAEIDRKLVNIANCDTFPLYGGSTVSEIDALKSQCKAMGDLLDKAEKALADRIASEPTRFNAALAIWQKRAQQAEAQRDMMRDQRDSATANMRSVEVVNVKLGASLSKAEADLAYANCTIDALTKGAKAISPCPPVGSIVTLKSGGPRMTVTDDMDNRAICSYWAGVGYMTISVPYAGVATLPN